MQTQYYKWFDIEIVHGYFIDGVCKNVVLVPFSETAELFANYKILIRKNDNITSVYVGTEESQASTIYEDLKNIGDLYFQLIAEDILFYKYTDMPVIAENQILLFENDLDHVLLHKQDTVSNLDLVPRGQINAQL